MRTTPTYSRYLLLFSRTQYLSQSRENYIGSNIQREFFFNYISQNIVYILTDCSYICVLLRKFQILPFPIIQLWNENAFE